MKIVTKGGRIALLLVGLGLCALIGFQADATPGKKKNKAANLKGLVTDSHGRPIADALVYLIDSSTIDTTSSLGYAAVLDGTADAYDEPLEDIVRNADKAKTLPQAKTNAKGQFSIKKLNAEATYYAFVVPGEKDVDHLPSGDVSRKAFSPRTLGKTGLKIKLSWKTPSGATYIGTSACYVCHGAGSPADATGCKKSAHALMFHRMSGDTANQNSAGHAGSVWNDLASKFTLATAYNAPVAPATSVKTLYFGEYDVTPPTNTSATPSATKAFIINEDSASTRKDYSNNAYTTPTYVKAYLWKTTAGVYKITLENIKNVEPNLEMEVVGTFGGYIRQRLLVKFPTSWNAKGLSLFVGFQAITGSASQGNDSNYDRTRRRWSNGGPGGSLTTFYSTASGAGQFKFITTPPALTATGGGIGTAAGCAACHVGGGPMYQQTLAERDAVTGERLTRSTPDSNGPFDLNGDGGLDDIGITCEVCHGPGSKHRDEAMKSVTAPPTTSKTKKALPEDFGGKYIVQPDLLSADRATTICARCHIGSNVKDVNAFAPPGISRAEFLANYIGSEKGPGASSFRPDGEHMNGGHEGIAFDNWLESKHSRNTKQMLACHDCHDVMGGTSYRYALAGDPDDSQNGLCNKCHEVNVVEHVPEMTGSAMSGAMMKCINCHMPRVGKGGAGRPGMILGTPAGVTNALNSVTSDANLYYWENDQSSHLWEVPNKFNPGVAGIQPHLAMPVPYTNSCGQACHDASKLRYQGSR
jgi:hypothetical protein